MNIERLAKVTKQIVAAIEYRKAGAYARAVSGDGEVPVVTVCLGPGRCMVPNSRDPGEVKVCSYCATLPLDATMEQAADFARQIVGGM